MMLRLFILSLSVLMIAGCSNKNSDEEFSKNGTPIETAFIRAAADINAPVRMLMAVSYVESGLRPNRSATNYLIQGQTIAKPPVRGESAFGLSFKELGIVEDSDFEGQVVAYGKLLKKRFQGKALPAKAVTLEEKMKWIWELAKIHRGEDSSRNVHSVFVREMIQVLNDGFSVQDKNGVVAKMERESTLIREQDLSENYKQDLQLNTYHSDIRAGYLFSLNRKNTVTEKNKPKRIEVIHCPFSLSSCIEMQDLDSKDGVNFSGHYLIPSSDKYVPGVLQFARHDESILSTDQEGSPKVISDRIVVVLAGLSGRYHEGARIYADPLWMTDFQLRLLSSTIQQVCTSLARTEGLSREQCIQVGGGQGVEFRQQTSESYHWGDIVDFDETIVNPYLQNPDGISATTTLTLNDENVIQAGQEFRLQSQFQLGVRRLELERLVRCPEPDLRVVWEPVHQQQVKQQTAFVFDMNWLDAGPNGTGDQYFRVRANGEGRKFLGWATKKVQLKGFDLQDVPVAASKYCLRNGT